MHKSLLRSICLALFISCALVVSALAQTSSDLTISLHRDFGYSGFNDIQGTFTLKAAGPADLSRVVFLIDDQVMAEVNQPPFQVSFNTGSYALGQHTLSATGYTSQGAELESNQIRPNFVSAEEGWQAGLKFALPILGIGLVIAVIAVVGPWLLGRRKPRGPMPDIPADYGLFGAAVCPRCGRPFARHWWGLNMMAGKLDRCPHCGKWSLVRRATPDRLQEAEDQVRQTIVKSQEPAVSEEQRLQRDLEDSRFQDM
jgi:DNA-directed RNA polymerase subunit RPC12/RpoP